MIAEIVSQTNHLEFMLLDLNNEYKRDATVLLDHTGIDTTEIPTLVIKMTVIRSALRNRPADCRNDDVRDAILLLLMTTCPGVKPIIQKKILPQSKLFDLRIEYVQLDKLSIIIKETSADLL